MTASEHAAVVGPMVELVVRLAHDCALSDDGWYRHGRQDGHEAGLYRCMYGECAAHNKNLNTALLKNFYSHDHCLLSKWKYVTCAETHHTHMYADLRRVSKEFT